METKDFLCGINSQNQLVAEVFIQPEISFLGQGSEESVACFLFLFGLLI